MLFRSSQRTSNLRTSNLRTSGRASELPSGGLAIRDFQGHVQLREGIFSFSQSKLETPGGIYWVSGAASPRRELSFTLEPAAGPRARPATAYSVRGTLAAPRVLPATLPAPESGIASAAAPARTAVAR